MRRDTTPRDMLLDRRVVQRNIRKGLVTREEYEAYLAGLGDVSDQAEEIRARLGEEEPDDEDEDADLEDDTSDTPSGEQDSTVAS